MGLALLVCVVTLPGAAAEAAAPTPARSYPGVQFVDGLRNAPTSSPQQSKLWFHDDAWWAVMLDPTSLAVRIFELLPDHTWRPTDTVLAVDPAETGDVLADGDTLHAVLRRDDEVLQATRLVYDPARREYTPTAPPAVITTRGSRAPATVAKDTTGRLWVAFATSSGVLVSDSADGTTWSEPFVPPVPSAAVSGREAAAIVAFGGNIGLMWSDQAAGAIRFAIHRDGAPVNEWRQEDAFVHPGLVEPELDVKVLPGAPQGVVAAVRIATGADGERPDSPLVLVLSRLPDGTWSRAVAGSVADGHSLPEISVDETNDRLLLVATSEGAAYYKSASLESMAFAPGRGALLAGGDDRLFVSEPTGTKQPLDARTGFVTVLSDELTRTYHHAEVPIAGVQPAGTRPDTVPPAAPADVWAGAGSAGTAAVYWTAAHDQDRRWSAAVDRVPAHEYVVYRDDVEVGRTEELSFGDQPPAAGTSYDYAVSAVDAAGNESVRTSVVVAVPHEATPMARLIALGLLVAGLVAAAVLFSGRLRRSRRLAGVLAPAAVERTCAVPHADRRQDVASGAPGAS